MKNKDRGHSGSQKAAAVALAAAALIPAGCRATDDRRTDPLPEQQDAGGEWVGSADTSSLEGAFYLAGGDPVTELELYELAPPYEEFELLAGGDAVSSVTACRRLVAFAGPDPYADHIFRARGTDKAPLPRVGTPRGSSPALSPGCRMLFIEPGERDGKDYFRLRDWRLGDPSVRTLDVFRRLGHVVAWGGDERYVISRAAFPPYELEVRGVGRGRRIRLGRRIQQLNALLWHKDGPIVVSQTDPPRTMTLSPRSGRTKRVIDGWEALAFSQDGTKLLVARQATLAVVDVASGDVSEVGETSIGPVYDGAWLSKSAL